MDNIADIMPRSPSYAPEVGRYIAISMPVLFCVGAALALWPVAAGWCEWWWIFVVGFSLMAFGGGGVWLWLMLDRNALLWEIETATGRDIDKDGQIGKPEPRQPETGKPTVRAPSGNRVLISDLLTFAKLAPDDKVGTSFQGFWSNRWPHEYWQDVMDVWARLGCVEPRRERHLSKWLKSAEEAGWLLLEYTSRPTP